MPKYPPLKKQTGITLMESLVAIVVTALGVLGILGSQIRTLTDTQTSVHRAQAIRLIEDLSERMRVNPQTRASLASNIWTTAWNAAPPARSIDCSSTPCNPEALARYDMQQWKQSVQALLPQGDAMTALALDGSVNENRKAQLGVFIAWRESEQEGTGTDAINYVHDITPSSGAPACPAGKTCHMQYIPIATRCYGVCPENQP